MPVTIQFKRGVEASIPTLASGEPGWCTDTKVLMIGDGSTNTQIGNGDVTGPASAVNNDVVLFNGTSGKIIKDSGLQLGSIATEDTPLVVASGGTGASDAATARSNLGLGSIATQNSSSVSITGGTITGISLTVNTDAYVNGTSSAIMLQRSGVNKVRLMAYSSGSTYLDYDGTFWFRSGINGTNRISISTGGNVVLSAGSVDAAGGFKVNGTAGISGSFTTADSKTVTVTNGIITSIA